MLYLGVTLFGQVLALPRTGEELQIKHQYIGLSSVQPSQSLYKRGSMVHPALTIFILLYVRTVTAIWLWCSAALAQATLRHFFIPVGIRRTAWGSSNQALF